MIAQVWLYDVPGYLTYVTAVKVSVMHIHVGGYSLLDLDPAFSSTGARCQRGHARGRVGTQDDDLHRARQTQPR